MNDEYIKLLLEEQFVARLRNSLQTADSYLTSKIKANKYDVEANAKRPKVRRDLKVIASIHHGISTELINQLSQRYELELEYINQTPAPPLENKSTEAERTETTEIPEQKKDL